MQNVSQIGEQNICQPPYEYITLNDQLQLDIVDLLMKYDDRKEATKGKHMFLL